MDRHDQLVRQRAFDYLVKLTDRFGDVLPYAELKQGFIFDDVRVPLLAPQGIFKPRILDLPLTIATAPNSPYDDAFTSEGLLQYKYRGTDRMHRNNVGLREAMKNGIPLIYLHGVVPGNMLLRGPFTLLTITRTP